MRTKYIRILFMAFACFYLSAKAQDSLGFTDSLEAKNTLLNGVKEGKWIEHYDESDVPSGEVYYCLTVYKAGRPVGIERAYYTDGHLYYIRPYKSGEANGLYKEYSENGVLRNDVPYVNGKANGMDKSYYESGKLYVETPFIKGKEDGVQKWYYENGNLEKETPYKNGERFGLQKEYFENGKLKCVSIDTVERIHKMIIGTWVDIASPAHKWVITRDTIKTESQCWTDYFISLEDAPGKKENHTYWFGINYLICGDSDITNRPNFGNISTDSTYLKFHDFGNEETFVFKRKTK